jgi:hypothetical protein
MEHVSLALETVFNVAAALHASRVQKGITLWEEHALFVRPTASTATILAAALLVQGVSF